MKKNVELCNDIQLLREKIEKTELFKYLLQRLTSFENNYGKEEFLRVILITQYGKNACPMKCNYCYFNTDNIPFTKMSVEEQQTVQQLIKQLKDRLNKKLQWVHFFGAEPLATFDLMKLFRELLPQDEQFFTFTSNCILITDEIQQWLDQNDVYLTLQSIDGYKELHDKNRKLRNGEGTFDKQLQGVFKLSNKVRRFMQWRQTWTQDTYDLVQIYEFFMGLGQVPEQISIIPDYTSNWRENLVFEQIKNLGDQFLKGKLNLKLNQQWYFTQQNIVEQMKYQPLFETGREEKIQEQLQIRSQISCQKEGGFQIYPRGRIAQCHINYEKYWTIGNYMTGELDKDFEKHQDKFQDFNKNFYKYLEKCKKCFQKQQCLTFPKCIYIIQPTRKEFQDNSFTVPDTFCEYFRGFVKGCLYLKKSTGDRLEKIQPIQKSRIKHQILRYLEDSNNVGEKMKQKEKIQRNEESEKDVENLI